MSCFPVVSGRCAVPLLAQVLGRDERMVVVNKTGNRRSQKIPKNSAAECPATLRAVIGRIADGVAPLPRELERRDAHGEVADFFRSPPLLNQATLKKWPKNGRKSVSGHKKGSFFSSLSC